MTAETKLLIAMYRLPDASNDEGKIALAAWELDPQTFGMRGYKYPDSKRVSTVLVYAVKHGLVERVAERTYALTGWGLKDAAWASKQLEEAKPCPATA